MVSEEKDVTTPTQEEFEDLQKKYADLQEKHKSSTTEWQRLHHKIEFLKDPSSFDKLYQTNKNFAKDIAQEYWYDDVDEFKEAVKWMKPSVSKKDDKQDDGDDVVDKAVQKIEEKALHKQAEAKVSSFLEERGVDLNSDFGKDVLSEYEDLVGKRKLTPEKAEKYITIAYREARQSSKHAVAYEQKMSELKAVGVWGKNTKAIISDTMKSWPQFNKPIKFREIYGKKD